MIKNNVFPLNDLANDPNARGVYPIVMQVIDLPATALVAGEFAFEVNSVVGTGLGTVWGVIPLDTIGTEAVIDGDDDLNASLSFKAVASGTAGKLTITKRSTDATSIKAVASKVLVIGQVTGG